MMFLLNTLHRLALSREATLLGLPAGAWATCCAMPIAAFLGGISGNLQGVDPREEAGP